MPTRLGPVNAGLENGGGASVSVNANPGGARACSGWGWYSEGSGHAGVSRPNKDGTSPIGAVLHIGLVGLGNRVNTADGVSFSAARNALAVALGTHSSARGGDGGAHKEQSANDCGELHCCE
jgi:hypothetical protein